MLATCVYVPELQTANWLVARRGDAMEVKKTCTGSLPENRRGGGGVSRV